MTHNDTFAHRWREALFAALALVAVAGCTARDYSTVDDIPGSVRESVRAAVDHGNRPAVVLGLLNRAGEHYYAYGTAESGKDVPVNTHTTFAIGSLTKLFTAQLLARQVIDGTVTLDTSLEDIWGELGRGGEIRLWQLASHRAGLPRTIPASALQKNDIEPVLQSLRHHDGNQSDPGYSNAGMALLAETLARQAQSSVSALMQEKILTPLDLASTSYEPDTTMLAHPHLGDEDIATRRSATVSVAYGAGGLHTSARDLVRFAQQLLHPRTESDADISALVMGQSSDHPALGWKTHVDGDLTVYHHGGDGNGYQGFIGLRPDNGVAVVLLSNSSADDDLQSIALHLLDPRAPLPVFDRPSSPPLDEKLLHEYAGRYGILDDPDGNTIELQTDAGRLIYIERGPDGDLVRRSRLYAENDHNLFLREIPVRLSFTDGTRASATLEFSGMRLTLVPLNE